MAVYINNPDFLRQHLRNNPDSSFFERYDDWPRFKKCRVLSKTAKVNGKECYVWSDSTGAETVRYYFTTDTFTYTGFALTVPKERRQLQ